MRFHFGRIKFYLEAKSIVPLPQCIRNCGDKTAEEVKREDISRGQNAPQSLLPKIPGVHSPRRTQPSGEFMMGEHRFINYARDAASSVHVTSESRYG